MEMTALFLLSTFQSGHQLKILKYSYRQLFGRHWLYLMRDARLDHRTVKLYEGGNIPLVNRQPGKSITLFPDTPSIL